MTHVIKKAKSLVISAEGTDKDNQATNRKGVTGNSYRSKMMVCIEILCTLSNGPLKMDQLTHKVELDKTRLIPHLKLLKNRELIEKQNLGVDKIYYAITDRGRKVLKVVGPIIKEAHKIQMRNFEVMSSILSGAGYS